MSSLRGKGECINQIMVVISCVSIKVTVSGKKEAKTLRTLSIDGPCPLSLTREIWEGEGGCGCLAARVRVSPFAIQMELLTLPAPRACALPSVR